VTRDEELAKLAALNAELAKIGVEPLFSPEVAQGAPKHWLRAAIRLTEEELLADVRRLREE
jgi:hypothetical protein